MRAGGRIATLRQCSCTTTTPVHVPVHVLVHVDINLTRVTRMLTRVTRVPLLFVVYI